MAMKHLAGGVKCTVRAAPRTYRGNGIPQEALAKIILQRLAEFAGAVGGVGSMVDTRWRATRERFPRSK